MTTFPLPEPTQVAIASGLALCVSGPYLVITEVNDDCVALYATDSLAPLTRFGTKGSAPGQFDFRGLYSGTCAGPAPASGFSTAFVADGGNNRVTEHVLPAGECVRTLELAHLVSPMVTISPTNVATNDTHIAVAALETFTFFVHSKIFVFPSSANGTSPPLQIIHGNGNSPHSRMNVVYGIQLSRDGTSIYVTDSDAMTARVLKISMANVSDVSDLTSKYGSGAIPCPHGVVECEDGSLLVTSATTDAATSAIFKIPVDGTGALESDDAPVQSASGLALASLPGVRRLFVRDEATLLVFNESA